MTFARPDIKPAFAKRNIAVAISTDESYLPHAKVLVNSIVASTKGGNVDMLIVHCGLPPGQRKSFLSCFAETKNLSVRFIDVRPVVESTELAKFKRQTYLSAAACYRLFLPDVLVSYDKLIYLDIDTIVCRDLGELYDVDVADNLIGAVLDVVNSGGRREYAEWARGHGFNEWDRYVNTGVLLFNLAEFRKASLFDKLLPIAVEASKWFCDQDALNFICKGRIAHLDPRWNVQVGDYCIDKQRSIVKGEAYVYHFTGSKKPWNHPEHRFARFWWRHSGAAGCAIWRKCLKLPETKTSSVDLSVIIPVFNAEQYLWESLMSVLGTPGSFHVEVICIDDGSTDGSPAILQTLQKLDSRVRLLKQSRQGPGAARNHGIENAKGDYVVFLDADDRFTSGVRLDALLKRAKEDKLDILVCGSNQMYEDGYVLRKAYLNESLVPADKVFGPEALGNDLYQLTPQSPWSKLYRRKFLIERGLSFPSLRRAEDFAFVQLAYTLAKRIGVEKASLVDHRVGVETSCEATKDETPLLFFDGEKSFRDSMKRRRILDKFKKAADISLVRRLAYNLGAVQRFDSFLLIAKKAAAIYRSLKKDVADAMPSYMANSVEALDKVVDNENNLGRLAELFVELRVKDADKTRVMSSDVALARSKQRCATFEKERDSLRGALDATRAVRDAALKERDSLRGALDATRAVRDAALKERDSLKRTLDSVRKVRDEALAKRESTKKSLDEVRGIRDAALKERDALKKTLDEVRKVRDAALKERDSLRGALDATRAVRDSALKERDALKKTLDTTRAVRDGALKERDSLKRALDSVRKVRDEALARRESAKKSLDEVRGIRDAALKERDSLRGVLSATRAVRDAALKERDSLRGTLDATRGIRDAALKERDTLRGTLDATRAVRDAALKERDTLRGTLDAARTVRDAAIRERNALRGKVDALSKACSAAQSERDAVDRELASLRDLHGKLREICGEE